MQSFTSYQIKGKGRGKFLGFPTINLAIPKSIMLRFGVYGVRVKCGNKYYSGAMHYGPIPTFKENRVSLEIFLLDIEDKESDTLDTSSVQVEPIEYIREVKSFSSKEALIAQMRADVEVVTTSLAG